MFPTKKPVVLFLLLWLPAYVFSQGNDTLHYSVILSGNIKGAKKILQKPDGSYESWYHYNDRGRGDSNHIEYRLDADGIPTYIRIRGNDYMKSPVSEDFSLTGQTAVWKNNAESSQKTIAGKAFYQSLYGECGNLVKALHAHNNRLVLLPSGEASLEVLQSHTVGKGAAARKLVLCSVKGLKPTPVYRWVDEQWNTFATVEDWKTVIRKGYEAAGPALLAIQKKVEQHFYRQLAQAQRKKITGQLLIRNTTLFDAEQARLLPHTDVLIQDGIIKAVSAGKPLTVKGAEVIDGSGQTLLPGLWDMHVHFSDNLDGIMHIAAGVTHVRDMGNDANLLVRMAQVKSGELIGPAVEIASGFIDGAGPYAAPTGALINNPEEGIAAIREYAKKGYQQIKLYSSLKPAWVKPLVEEARRHHMRVCGHIPAFMTAAQAIDAGYNEVTHLNMLVLNFFGDTIDTRTPQRFAIPAQKAAGMDLHGADMEAFIAMMKAKDITVDPTVNIFEALFTGKNGETLPKDRYMVDHLPAVMQREFRAGGGGLPVSPELEATYKKSFEVFLQLVKLLYDKGIRIVPGTDDVPGFDLHYELELYVRAGIPAEKVLQLATWGPAGYTGNGSTLGSIKTGKKADMILVGGNPVSNIHDIRNTRLVITGGAIYRPSALYPAIGITPFSEGK
ncbi:amidohydrolase family protein [Chitinophaga nivalis]|uniref:Amidohydrolase family protein n=1 Tax=Chitinophaga nivalis TaxID=2991709 RepID=A0ABT3IH62_9BACT|nr:amidohydrolase family protein [Chitinophaga nivalis]MCW3467163.1 amidohydrolase family protein [Chitinophaga nivalis]MCW3483145.1 amidohydrolase family protein [Chitinophaga nivalis]